MGKPLSVRLTDDQREGLERLAREAGMKPSTYVRTLIDPQQYGAIGDPELFDRIENFEKRLARLEEMAGL